MVRRWIGLTALCLLRANALIIPAGIAPASDTPALPPIIDPKNRLVRLSCPQCAFSSSLPDVEKEGENNDVFWLHDPNDVLLNFSVSPDGTALDLNGETIFTPGLKLDALTQRHPIYVDQVSATASTAEISKGEARSTPLEVTSSGLTFRSKREASPDGDAVVSITFQIMGLEKEAMLLDEVDIDVLQTGDGQVYILKAESSPTANLAPFPAPHRLDPQAGDMKDCSTLPDRMCRLKNIIEAQVAAMRHATWGSRRPCFRKGRPGALALPPPDSTAPEENSHGHLKWSDRTRQFWPHHHHRHHLLHALARSLIAVLLPIMAGISAGLCVSLLGLVVGRLIRYIWINFVRGGQRGNASQEYSSTADDEDKILVEDVYIEALPVYELPPAYETHERELP